MNERLSNSSECSMCGMPMIVQPWDNTTMYNTMCRECAERIKRNLYRKGKLEKTQKKFKVR